jgi:hypothetical protein
VFERRMNDDEFSAPIDLGVDRHFACNSAPSQLTLAGQVLKNLPGVIYQRHQRRGIILIGRMLLATSRFPTHAVHTGA